MDAEDDPVLAPIQLWALERQPEPTDFWNQSIEIRLPEQPSGPVEDVIRQSLVFLSNFHSVLRTKILLDGRIVPLPPISEQQLPLRTTNLREGDNEGIEQVYSQIQHDLNQQINFSSDVLLGGAIVSQSVDDHRLLMVANHLAMDAVSWHQWIEDFKICYQAYARGSVPDLATVPTFARWSNTLKAAAGEDRFTSQLDYWISALQVPPPFPQPIRGSATAAPVEVVSFSSATQSQQLEMDLRRGRVSIHELLLAAFAKALSNWSRQDEFRVFLESHGREPIRKDLDFSRTVGWFTSLAPLRLAVPRESSPGPNLLAIKDQIRDVPAHGIGYGMLRYLSDDSAIRDALATNVSEVVFNYLGRTNRETDVSAFSISRSLQLHRSPGLQRFAALEANIVFENRLRIGLEYDPSQFDGPEIQALADGFVKNIEGMAAYCAGDGAGQATVSDFPLAKLDSQQLTNLASLLNQAESKGDDRK